MILQWIAIQRAEGRNERMLKSEVQDVLREYTSLNNAHAGLHQIDFNDPNWNDRILMDERDDIIYGDRDPQNTLGNVSDLIEKKVSTQKLNRYVNQITGNSTNNNNNNFNKNGNQRYHNSTPRYHNGTPKRTYYNGASKLGKHDLSDPPLIQKFIKPEIHRAWIPNRGSTTPNDYCELFQTDSCNSAKYGQYRCNKHHRCKWCGLPHPGSKCRKRTQ